VRIWDLERDGTPQILTGFVSRPNAAAWNSAADMLAIGGDDCTVRVLQPSATAENVNIYNADACQRISTLAGHSGGISAISWSPHSDLVATASLDGTVGLWDCADWNMVARLVGHAAPVTCVAWHPKHPWLISASADATIRVWDESTGRLKRVIEGHTGPVSATSLSPDGAVLATRALLPDRRVLLWRTETWDCVGQLDAAAPNGAFTDIAFHPTDPLLAVPTAAGNVLLLCVDAPRMQKQTALVAPEAVTHTIHYQNAKVFLLGDTGVGKSTLARAVAKQPSAPTFSTHNRNVYLRSTSTVEDAPGLKFTREVFIWDLAGQPGYRIIHQLHLPDIALALLVFDSRTTGDPFATPRYWSRALQQTTQILGKPKRTIPRILVSAREDVGPPLVSRVRISEVLVELNARDFLSTSAKERWGIDELQAAIDRHIDWTSLPITTSSELFYDIKRFVIASRQVGSILRTVDDLYVAYLQECSARYRSTDLPEQFFTCLSLLQTSGTIQLLNFGNLVLLQPEVRDAYASALVQAATRDSEGLGTVDEEDAHACRFPIAADQKIGDQHVAELLMIATIENLIRNELVMREASGGSSLLVFPTQLTRDNPESPYADECVVEYDFEGPVLNIYASLAVRLARSGVFRKDQMWRNGISFKFWNGDKEEATEDLCGLVLSEKEGTGTLSLFFVNATDHIRVRFDNFVEDHLRRQAVPGTLRRRAIFRCLMCRELFTDSQVIHARQRNRRAIRCVVCETETPLVLGPRDEQVLDARVRDMANVADRERARAAARSVVRGKEAIGEFDVFLCYHGPDLPEVLRVCEMLKDNGLSPWVDHWNVRPGSSWIEAVSEVLRKVPAAAVCIGSDGSGRFQNQEIEALLHEFADGGRQVIPVILPLRDPPPEPKVEISPFRKRIERTPPNLRPELPLFLRSRRTVNFRLGAGQAMDELMYGITGQRFDYRRWLDQVYADKEPAGPPTASEVR
jgi:GTPase SAR1 family protein